MFQKLFSLRQKFYSYFKIIIINTKLANHSFFLMIALMLWNIIRGLEKSKYKSCHGERFPRDFGSERASNILSLSSLNHKTHVPFLNFGYIYLDPNSRGSNAKHSMGLMFTEYLIIYIKFLQQNPGRCIHVILTLKLPCRVMGRDAPGKFRQGSGDN